MAESEEEVDVLVQRVVKDITNAFKKNPNIDEVGVIPCPEARCNRSPIVLVENKLGVESWCIKFLLPCVHNKLLLYRQRHHWLDREALVDITCTLLLLNPDFTTAWNVRKELVQCGVLNPEKDLYLGQLALTRSPKSPETWIHRRWVLQHILHQSSAPPPPQPAAAGRSQELSPSPQPTATGWSQELNPHLSQTLHQEMKVCADAASRYPSNYNAWSHRIWVLQHMAKGNVKVFHDELSSMSRWVSRHVSDHSGFHYRQFLLQELITELCPPQQNDSPPEQLGCPSQEYDDPPQKLGCPPQQHDGPHTNGELSGAEATAEEERQLGLFSVFQLFHQEMVLCSDLIQSFPGHETLWSHRRHVFYLWHQWRTERHCSSRGDMDGDDAALQDARPARERHCSSRGDMDGDDAALQDARPAREPVKGPRWGIEPMEVDRASVSDPQDSKRLKRGVALPSLPSEHGFVSGVLRSCCCHEQRRFAAAYRKWLDAVVHPTPALSQHSSCL